MKIVQSATNQRHGKFRPNHCQEKYYTSVQKHQLALEHLVELEFDDIKNSMNGYGRIIYFRCHDDHKPEHQHLEYIQEGKFRNGLMNGYCRDMSIIDGEAHCKLGFWKDGEPSGKYQKFDLEGNSLQEGIMEGETMKKEIKIQNFLTQSVKQGVKANYYKGVSGGLSSFEANAMGTFGTGGVQGMETKMAEYAMKKEMQSQEDAMKKKMENQFEHLIWVRFFKKNKGKIFLYLLR